MCPRLLRTASSEDLERLGIDGFKVLCVLRGAEQLDARVRMQKLQPLTTTTTPQADRVSGALSLLDFRYARYRSVDDHLDVVVVGK